MNINSFSVHCAGHRLFSSHLYNYCCFKDEYEYESGSRSQPQPLVARHRHIDVAPARPTGLQVRSLHFPNDVLLVGFRKALKNEKYYLFNRLTLATYN